MQFFLLCLAVSSLCSLAKLCTSLHPNKLLLFRCELTAVTAMRASFRSHILGAGKTLRERSHVFLCGLSDKMLDLSETICLGHL